MAAFGDGGIGMSGRPVSYGQKNRNAWRGEYTRGVAGQRKYRASGAAGAIGSGSQGTPYAPQETPAAPLPVAAAYNADPQPFAAYAPQAPASDTMYTGGTPNFDERTGQPTAAPAAPTTPISASPSPLGAAQPIQPPPQGTAYAPQASPVSLAGGMLKVQAPAAKPPADQAGYDAYLADSRGKWATNISPSLTKKFEQRAREQWDRWTPDQRDHAVSAAKRRAPDASRASAGFGYADYTDPQTGEKFLADSQGRLTNPRDLINHYSSNPNPAALAQQAAGYHDRGLPVPEWLKAAATNVNAKSNNAWYDLRYMDKTAWDAADEPTRYNVRNRK